MILPGPALPQIVLDELVEIVADLPGRAYQARTTPNQVLIEAFGRNFQIFFHGL